MFTIDMEDFTMREIEATEKDYNAYVQCIYRTEFSHEKGKGSEERDVISLYYDPAPTFNFFCKSLKHDNPYSKEHTFVYEDAEGNVVAVATINKVGDIRLEIQKFVVDWHYQLLGYGRKFYEEIERSARKEGRKKIVLRCTFEGAMAFWSKMGFSHEGYFIKGISY